MTAVPSLNGSVGYIFTSCDLDVKNSRDVRFKDMIERFKVYDQPRKPDHKEEEWLAGERTDTRGNSPLNSVSNSLKFKLQQTIFYTDVCIFRPVGWMHYTRLEYLLRCKP
jgi:hypothetical protein